MNFRETAHAANRYQFAWGEGEGRKALAALRTIVRKSNLSAAVAVSAILGVGSASAADLPARVYTKAPADVPVMTYNWTGGYGGISGGYGWGHSDQTDPGIAPPPAVDYYGVGDGHFSLNGGLLGGTLGINRQLGPWVFGLEGDFSWADIKGQSDVCGPTTVTPHPCGTKLDALGTFRGRVGYAAGANGNWLLYATGGLAVGDVGGWDSLTPASGSDWRAGWTVGAGVETAFAPNWTAKLEYLYVDLGNAQLFNIVPGVPESVGFTANLLRAGINYRFGDPAAAPQSYTKVPYTKAPPPAPGWTGYYVGLNAGATWGGQNGIDVVSAGTFNPSGYNPAIMNQGAAGATAHLSNGNDNGGFIGGGQIGYNYQVANWVFGIEADIQGISGGSRNFTASTSVMDNNGLPVTTQLEASKQLDYLGTVRGRLGFLATPTLLLYGTGGLAYGGVKSSASISQLHVPDFAPGTTSGSTAASFSEARAGWTAGAGLEWLFMPNWSAKAEYLYYDLGDVSYSAGLLQAADSTGFVRYAVSPQVSSRFDGNIVRVGVNYHFN
jgi:outer membrane immunogenic protein